MKTNITSWTVYMLRTRAGSLYTGITTDVARRLEEHRSGARGAKSLRGKGPLALVYQYPAPDRSTASRLEARIKKLTRPEKEALLAGDVQILASITVDT